MLEGCKNLLKSNYKMTDLGNLHWFLGINFTCSEGYIAMDQTKYIQKLLQKFNMTESFPINTPCDQSLVNTSDIESNELTDPKLYREIVGSLIYIMTATRPDIAFAVTKLSQFMSKPTKAHLNAARRVLRYLKGSLSNKLIFTKSEEPMNLLGYSDSDWGSGEDRKKHIWLWVQTTRNRAADIVEIKEAAGSCSIHLRSRVYSFNFSCTGSKVPSTTYL